LEIHFHAHHAEVSPAMRKRAERLVERAALRIPRVGPSCSKRITASTTRRVSLALRAPKNHDLLGRGEGRFFGPALATAITRVLAQAKKEEKGSVKSRVHRLARARA
jgi:hypothetical protein